MQIELTVNNEKVVREIYPSRRLIDFLREDLFLTGTKEGCGEGECGACTVLVDNKPVNGCLLLAAQVQNKNIMTIEGIRETEIGKKLITSFTELGAIQCGFCTPGLIMISYALVKELKNPSLDLIKKTISGNLCRCTGYQKVVEAISNVTSLKEYSNSK